MKIVIVGGGLSGWLSAFSLSKKYSHHKFVVIDSSKIPTIGVGEGTTGLFCDKFLRGEDFTVKEFFKETKATPKLGIQFNDWSTKKSFLSPIDGSFTKNCHIDGSVYFDYSQNNTVGKSSLCGVLRSHDRIPFYRGFEEKYGVEEDFSWEDTAVHLDNEKTINFFKSKTLERKNVSCIDSSVVKINRTEKLVLSIECENSLTVDGDLFLDCTGFKRILSKDIKWIDFSSNLPVNSVVTFQMEHDNTNLDLVTQANAMNDGWSWVIPTQERYGAGYVYCDYFTNEDKVTDEILKKYPSAKLGRHFKFKSGKQKTCWNDNVISIGLSYQFLEPLQATSIHLTLIQLELLDKYCIKPTISYTLDSNSRKKFNEHMDRVIENYKDFVNIHYSGDRTDTKFWKYISKQFHLTKFSKHILKLLKTRGLFYWDFTNEYGTTGQELWIYTLLGLHHLNADQCFALLNNSGIISDTAMLYSEKSTPKQAIRFMPYQDFIERLNT